MDGDFTFGSGLLMTHVPPAGFATGSDGIYVEIESKDGEVQQEWLCSPIAVVALGRNATQTGWNRRIELIDPDGVLHQWYIPDSDLTVGFNKVLAGLRDRGLKLATGASARKHLVDLLVRWEPIGRYVTTDRLGWASPSCSAFVLGDKRVIGNTNTVFLNDAVPEGAPEMKSCGTLDEWRTKVGERCIGNPILTAAVSLAFAGPLLELLGKESAGMHLRGGSSSGKTTALGAAVSVWGSPKLMHSWRATANALEGVAATCNGSLLALDELGQVSGRDVGDAIYTLANGQGKARSTSSGKLQPMSKWRLMFLSTGEISLADKMAEAGKKPMTGQDVRLIDISADTRRFGVFDELHGAVDSGAFAKELKKATAGNYGTVGPKFIETLISNKANLSVFDRMIMTLAEKWKDTLENSCHGPTERVFGHFALIAVAGEAATKFSITGWQTGDAIKAVFELAREWRDAQDRSEQWQVQAALERCRNFLLAHADTRFEVPQGTPVPNCAGYRDDKWFYILGDAWSEIHLGHSPGEQAKHLIAERWMAGGDGKNLKSKTPSWVPGRPRAYKVRIDILETPVESGIGMTSK